MIHQDSLQSLAQFYGSHLVNEEAILQQLQSQGVSLDTLSEEVLKDYDMDHYDGTEAIDILAQKARIDASSYVLDVCSGIGGPARYLAHRYGCRVMGLDITESRYQSALRLTKMVKLDHLVDFRLGNALEMPFAENTFDVIIGQEAWTHIPDKSRFFGECARVLKPGRMIAFTDSLRRGTLQPSELARWQHHWGGIATPETFESYSRFLDEAGFTEVKSEDLGAHWAKAAAQQHENMKLSPSDYHQFDETSRFAAEMMGGGKMGGGRFIARLGAAEQA